MAAAAPIDIGTLIVSTPGVCGGSPRIAGTRIPVKAIAELYNDGWSAERIAAERPAAELNEVHAAIAYYLTNKQAVDEDIAAGDAFIAAYIAEHPESLSAARAAAQE